MFKVGNQFEETLAKTKKESIKEAILDAGQSSHVYKSDSTRGG